MPWTSEARRASSLGSACLLRHHPPPQELQLQMLDWSSTGRPLNASTSGETGGEISGVDPQCAHLSCAAASPAAEEHVGQTGGGQAESHDPFHRYLACRDGEEGDRQGHSDMTPGPEPGGQASQSGC